MSLEVNIFAGNESGYKPVLKKTGSEGGYWVCTDGNNHDCREEVLGYFINAHKAKFDTINDDFIWNFHYIVCDEEAIFGGIPNKNRMKNIAYFIRHVEELLGLRDLTKIYRVEEYKNILKIEPSLFWSNAKHYEFPMLNEAKQVVNSNEKVNYNAYMRISFFNLLLRAGAWYESRVGCEDNILATMAKNIYFEKTELANKAFLQGYTDYIGINKGWRDTMQEAKSVLHTNLIKS